MASVSAPKEMVALDSYPYSESYGPNFCSQSTYNKLNYFITFLFADENSKGGSRSPQSKVELNINSTVDALMFPASDLFILFKWWPDSRKDFF